jgi:hypothetical protein
MLCGGAATTQHFIAEFSNAADQESFLVVPWSLKCRRELLEHLLGM